MNQLFINGNDATNDVTDFSDFTLEVGFNSNKTIIAKLSERFRFDKDTDTYTLLKDTFFASCGGFKNEINGQFKTSVCGGIVIPLKVSASDAIYSEQYIEVLMESSDEDQDSYSKLGSTYWFDNDYASAFKIPVMYFAVTPSFLSWVILLLVMQVRIVLNVIDEFMKTVCKILTLGFGKCDVNISASVFRRLDNWILGVGRWACAPLVRQILQYQCSVAGLNFQSSYFAPGSPYYNMAMFDLSRGEKGSYRDTSDVQRRNILYGNGYLMTVLELVNRMAELFEAEYRIIDGTLYLEPKDFFYTLRNKLIAKSDKCTLYQYDVDDMYAFGEFKFSEDFSDKEGNKSLALHSLLLDWNNPPSSYQKGKLSRQHAFGASRFMFDLFSFERDGFFDIEFLIDNLRDGPDTQLESFVNTDNIIRRNDLCVSDDLLSYPKLIVLEDNFNYNDAIAIRKTYKRRSGKQFYIYNYPLLYKESKDRDANGKLVRGTEGDLAQYAAQANPRLRKDIMKIEEMSFGCECVIVENITNHFHTIYIDTLFGKGYPESAIMKFSSNTIEITLKDIVVECN